MKFTTIALAAAASLASTAVAANCQTGLQYCGYVLLRKGNYYAQIAQALDDANMPTDPSHIQNTLFQCVGGPNGDIDIIRYCGAACQDGGNNHSDTC
ncbi:conserved hypothetical protein [Aspergillus terreus NIH2624]|uniref:Uncharacterized protein n=1 Tax=Aspergillus terreus (strain NIH 2624 / FGSC A1156) TaxID=341663 RepID=Q0CEY4_ASPTN|nr:uncharacterized protein ATEG_07750 [Aspergillus terreus NIH2624]EAU32012.1 conserved hypothetical protein [Aspergillus terreus NIH2624]KAG2420205.1 hypothetical protein HFD88_005005 [Aspergillus terreus]